MMKKEDEERDRKRGRERLEMDYGNWSRLGRVYVFIEYG